MLASNDEVERRGVALPQNEDPLSKSSTPSLAYRSRTPRSLELLKWTPPGWQYGIGVPS
jgi:hypothetical protein